MVLVSVLEYFSDLFFNLLTERGSSYGDSDPFENVTIIDVNSAISYIRAKVEE